MEPKDPNKKFEDILKNINFSFTVPVGVYKFNLPVETVEETIARLDEVDETVDAMTSYPLKEVRLAVNIGQLPLSAVFVHSYLHSLVQSSPLAN